MNNIISGKLTKQQKAARNLKPLADFRNEHPGEVVHIPVHRSRRKLTDVAFLILLGLCLLTLFCLMIYTSLNSDFKKISHGFDRCGNVCGKNNKKIDNSPCSGQDMTDKPYNENGNCVAHCSTNLDPKTYFCTDTNDEDETLGPGLLSYRSFLAIGVCALGIVFSILMLFFIKYFTSIFVHSMLIGGFLLLVAATIAFGVLSAQDSELIALAIFFAIITLVVLILYFVIKKRIELLIKLLEEVTKIVFKMPQIFCVPILTFLGILLATFMVIYTIMMTITSGEIVVDDDAYMETSPIMTFVICFSVFIFIWMVQFLIACQVFVVAGSVSQKYFETYTAQNPVSDNFYNLVRFHMGSTAFGSIAVTILTIIVMILNSLSRRWRVLNCCCTNLKEMFQYVTTMGYIEVAMHGESLCKSGARAVNLIVANALSAFAINSVGDFVFFMGKVFVVALTVVCGYLILGTSSAGIVLTVIVGVVTFFIIHSIFGVLSVALDTVFLCYCEDRALNNGTQNNPYAGTIGFENYIRQAQMFEKKGK